MYIDIIGTIICREYCNISSNNGLVENVPYSLVNEDFYVVHVPVLD